MSMMLRDVDLAVGRMDGTGPIEKLAIGEEKARKFRIQGQKQNRTQQVNVKGKDSDARAEKSATSAERAEKRRQMMAQSSVKVSGTGGGACTLRRSSQTPDRRSSMEAE
eukprot:7251649-Prymnesium_polylepis.1